mgnify:CR=1 FL=1
MSVMMVLMIGMPRWSARILATDINHLELVLTGRIIVHVSKLIRSSAGIISEITCCNKVDLHVLWLITM